MENKRSTQKKKIFLIVGIVILLVAIILCLRSCTSSDAKDENPDGVVYESQISDESPLSSQYKIVFPGFSKKTIKYRESQKISLQNPSGNSVDFIYSIEYQGELVHTSARLSPGEIEKWNPREVFKTPGVYEVKIVITPYDHSNNPKNGFEQNFKFEII